MPDNLQIPSSESQELIHIEDPYDLRDWAIYFSISRERLREAVLAVGPAVEDVKHFLGK